MAKLIKDIFGVPDGEVYPRKVLAGTECPPALENYARLRGALETEEGAVPPDAPQPPPEPVDPSPTPTGGAKKTAKAGND